MVKDDDNCISLAYVVCFSFGLAVSDFHHTFFFFSFFLNFTFAFSYEVDGRIL